MTLNYSFFQKRIVYIFHFPYFEMDFSFKSIQIFCARFANASWFNNLIIGLIIINAIVLGLDTYPQLSIYSPIFNLVNNIVLFAFVVEAIAKIISVAPLFSKYFLNPWDLFDFIVTVVSFIPAIGPMITIVRLVRLLRIVRIVRKFDNLRVIIEALIKSLSSMAIVFMLLLLLLYVYGIMGVHLFRGVDPQFWGTLGSSIITLFTIATLTNWDVRLVNTLSAHPFAWVYFFSFVIIAAMILINLFVGIMLHNVTEANKKNLAKQGIVDRDDEILEEIKQIKQSIKKLEQKRK